LTIDTSQSEEDHPDSGSASPEEGIKVIEIGDAALHDRNIAQPNLLANIIHM
jgi:hypothetical protein